MNRLVELLGVGSRKGNPSPQASWRTRLHLGHTFKIKREIGWEPRVSFESGVGHMLAAMILEGCARLGREVDSGCHRGSVQRLCHEL